MGILLGWHSEEILETSQIVLFCEYFQDNLVRKTSDQNEDIQESSQK